jgi:hypothetical protein
MTRSTPAGFDMRDQEYLGAPAALATRSAPHELYAALARLDHDRKTLWVEVWWRDPKLPAARREYALGAAQAGVEEWRHLPAGYRVRIVPSRRPVVQGPVRG